MPIAYTALAVSECPGLQACDKGKGDKCTDVLAATNTWLYAIKYLRKAAEGRVDEGTYGHILQIETGEYRPSDADFPRVVYNNRLIFNNLHDWLEQHRKIELSPEDKSLPTP